MNKHTSMAVDYNRRCLPTLPQSSIYTGNLSIFYHADGLGSIVALTNSSGVVTTRYAYDPYGETEVAGTDVPQPFRFTGREWDAETGLYFYRARYYSPDMGRFISEDPIGYAGGINFYAYVGNDPVNFVDPSGFLSSMPDGGQHAIVTYDAAIEAGFPSSVAHALADAVAAVDSRPGSQGTDAASANMHAMAGENQKPLDAIRATLRLIRVSLANCDIALALHAAQDFATPLHRGIAWDGGKFTYYMITEHVPADVFPSKEVQTEAYFRSFNLLMQYKEMIEQCQNCDFEGHQL
jgi:RHS repeat-associated protein